MDIEEVMKAFDAGQHAAFREQVALWVSDETISDEDFSRKVSDLDYDLAMNRIAFEAGVDTTQQDN